MGVSMFQEYAELEKFDPRLRRIAKAAGQQGLSMRGVAKAAGLAPSTCSQVFNISAKPRWKTIDRLSRAVGLSPMRLRAELDEMEAADYMAVGQSLIRAARELKYVVPNAQAMQRFSDALKTAANDILKRSLRAYVIAGGFDGSAAEGSDGVDSAVRAFAEEFKSCGFDLLGLLQVGNDYNLWMIATELRHLDLKPSEVKAVLASILGHLHKRDSTRAEAQLAYLRNARFAVDASCIPEEGFI